MKITKLQKQSASGTYDPNRLLDTISENMNLKNDAALSRALQVEPPVISKIRHRKLGVGDSLLVRIHDMTSMPINDIRTLMGVPAVTQSAAG